MFCTRMWSSSSITKTFSGLTTLGGAMNVGKTRPRCEASSRASEQETVRLERAQARRSPSDFHSSPGTNRHEIFPSRTRKIPRIPVRAADTDSLRPVQWSLPPWSARTAAQASARRWVWLLKSRSGTLADGSTETASARLGVGGGARESRSRHSQTWSAQPRDGIVKLRAPP